MSIRETTNGIYHSFSNAFFNALAATMTRENGSTWLISASPNTESTPDQSEPVRVSITLDGSLHGEFQLEFHRAEAITLVSQILRKSIDGFGAEESNALLKAIDAGANECRSALAKDYGTFMMRAALTSEPVSDIANIVSATFVDDDANRVSMSMSLSARLTEALALHSRVVAEGRQAIAEKEIPEPVNLNLVMDVELNVTLRFGQRQLTLREVLDLTSGSVIELDRQVEEPVELLLEGKVIARGEAVVIDGNYGLRVTEVSQPFSPRSSIGRDLRFADSEKVSEEPKRR
jgi:flagellar motor switch protein FliN/FliY